MSVINQMLKELEERKESADNSAERLDLNSSPHAQTHESKSSTESATAAPLQSAGTSKGDSGVGYSYKGIVFGSLITLFLVGVGIVISQYLSPNIQPSGNNQPVPTSDKAALQTHTTEKSVLSQDDSVVNNVPKDQAAKPSVSASTSDSNNANKAGEIRERATQYVTNLSSAPVNEGSASNNEIATTGSNSNPPVVEAVAGEVSTNKPVSSPTDKQAQVKEPIIKSGTLSISKVSMSKEQKLTELYNQGYEEYQKGIIEPAIEKFSTVLKLDEKHQDARSHLAAALFGRNQVVQVIQLLEQGLDLFPEHQRWRLMLAKLFYEKQQFDYALKYLLPSMLDADTEYWVMRGTLAQKVGEQQLAKESFLVLTQRLPNQAKWWLGLAIAYEQSEEVSNAIAAYQKTQLLSGLSVASQQFVTQKLIELGQ